MTARAEKPVVDPDSPTSEDVFREFGAQLRVFVQRRVTDPQRAEDVLGEIVLRIHRNLGRVDDHEHLTRWVYRIARNAIVDEYRRAERERARERVLPDDARELGEAGDDDDPTVLRELAECLRPLLDGLPPEQRRALELTDLEGLTQVDAAGREGVSVSGMKSRVQRGRRRLAVLLGRCCELTLDAQGTPMDYTPPAGRRCD